MRYARKLTKEDLIRGGITEITPDCMVFRDEKQVIPYMINNQGYFTLTIYEVDEHGNKIKVPIRRYFKGCINPSDTYIYKTRTIGLHRAMWAWFFDEVPAGYVVDHINNKHDTIDDYRLENLQILTPQENLIKDRDCNTREVKCKLDRPLSYYEDKLKKYLDKYEAAKDNRDPKLAHKFRTNIANTKARIRYYKSHKEN